MIRISGDFGSLYGEDEADESGRPYFMYDSGDDGDYSPMEEVVRRRLYRRRKSEKRRCPWPFVIFGRHAVMKN